MCIMDASIIIPVYNQFSSLIYVLKGFSRQKYDLNKFEIIVVDDGSNDSLSLESSHSLSKISGLNVMLIHQNNKGRAIARNVGVEMSNSEFIIFCDGDRIPHENFVKKHIESSSNLSCVNIGAAYDFFGKMNLFFNNDSIDWSYAEKMSRLPSYYKKIISKNKINDELFQKYSWLSFLVGNSSIYRNLFKSVGGFDDNITRWGFEHFELGYRLFKNQANFTCNTEIISYHIPHSRPNGFYEMNIKSNIDYICNKHVEIDRFYLLDFFGMRESI